MPILETQDLTYVYGAGTPFEKTAVDHISLQIEEGELVGVIGHTGSGKSTFVQQLNGLLKPTSGKVLLKGKDIWAEPKRMLFLRYLQQADQAVRNGVPRSLGSLRWTRRY